jgi:hypothetical protein
MRASESVARVQSCKLLRAGKQGARFDGEPLDVIRASFGHTQRLFCQ